MKLFCLITSLFLLASPVSSETFLLARSGHWETSYVDGAPFDYCHSLSKDTEGQRFDITFWDHEAISIHIFLNHYQEAQYRKIDFTLHIDDEIWNFHDAELHESMISITLTQNNETSTIIGFLEDLVDSTSVSLIGSFGDPIANWSLLGISDALVELADCAGKL